MESSKPGDLEVDLSTLTENPHCPHGPTLLFRRRFTQNGKSQSKNAAYYACSAYRDVKECRFHLPFSAKRDPSSLSQNSRLKNQQLHGADSSRKRKRDLISDACRPETLLDSAEAFYCQRCSRVLEEDEVNGHKHRKEIEQVDPRFPSRFLPPLNEKQAEAQYFFNKNTVKFLLGLIKSQKVTHVVHIGCPRLHEEASSLSDIEAKTFLLDIDSRFARFFPRTSFAQYNMFNNHFLTELGRDDYQSFISGVEAKNLLIVMDPPFGGRVEVLAHNLRRLFADIGGECSVAWIFPYFMEKHIIREFANFKMLDYKIEYDNHRKFKKTNSASSRASPVRLFTNVKPESIPHSSEEGYWFCKECRRFSAGENKHCLACGLCPSKDGKVWRHCRTCSQCVKSDWIHCKKCQRCHGKDCVAKTELSVKSNHLSKK